LILFFEFTIYGGNNMIYNKKNNTIITERLILRPFNISDAENVTKLCNNYNLYKNTLHLPYPYTLDCALYYIETHITSFSLENYYKN